MKLGDNIRKVRKLKGYKQAHVATMVHMSVTAYGDIERNKSDVLFGKLEEIAAVLEVKVVDIININDNSISKTISNFNGFSLGGNKVDDYHVPEKMQVYKIAIDIAKKEIEHLRKQNEELMRIFNRMVED